MSYLVSLCFALFVFLPCALLLGGLMDLAYDRFVLGRVARRRRS